jgi:excisionase family DNA binding protein
MEKFCIVKRRKPSRLVEQITEGYSTGNELETVIDHVPQEAPPVRENNVPDRQTPEPSGTGHTVRILLTPEQCRVERLGDDEGQLFGRIVGEASVDMERNDENQIVLNLHLKYAHGARMLNAQAVCEMLQVSRGFLAKSVKGGRLKSYKIGRLRRFLLEDVLEYISHNSELCAILTAEPQYRCEDAPLPADRSKSEEGEPHVL